MYKKISPTRFELVTLRLSNYSLTLFQLSYGEDTNVSSSRKTSPSIDVRLAPTVGKFGVGRRCVVTEIEGIQALR